MQIYMYIAYYNVVYISLFITYILQMQYACVFSSIQESVEDIQKRSELSLLKSEESFSSQLRLLEQARDKLEAKSSRMKEELNATRRQEAHLRAMVADLGQQNHRL